MVYILKAHYLWFLKEVKKIDTKNWTVADPEVEYELDGSLVVVRVTVVKTNRC